MKKLSARFFTLQKAWKWVCFLVFTSLFGLSCHKDELAPGFDMVYQRDFSIQAGIGIFDVHHFQLKNIPSNWSDYMSLHGKKTENIKAVVNAKATLSGIYGDADLSVVDRISIRLYDETNPNDYVEIAYRDPTPIDSGNLLPIIPSLADAKRFLVLPRFSADVVIWLRRTTKDQNDVRLDFTMRAGL